MKRPVILILGSYLIGSLIVYWIAGTALFIAYSLLWFDKLILRAFLPLRWTGVEFTTIASVIAAFSIGPFGSFMLITLFSPIVRTIKLYALPFRDPGFPVFLPHPYAVVDGLGGYVAGLAIGFGFFGAAAFAVAFKFIAYGLTAMFIFGRPFGFFNGIIFSIFNVAFFALAGVAIAQLAGIAV